MMSIHRNQIRRSIFLFFLFLTVVQVAFTQDEVPGKVYHFDGGMSITNNGFSFIPLFSLGKPAMIADLSVGGERFSFDPQIRFDLDGFQPWSFIFIWRYRLIQTDRFQLKIGTHLPAYSFREQTVLINGTNNELPVPSTFLALELLPTYSFSDKFSIGMYYLHGRGVVNAEDAGYSHFISLRSNVNHIMLTKSVYLNWNPQIYYLDLVGAKGFYFAQSISFAHSKLPVSLATMMNITLQSELSSPDFDWNISLIYSFNNRLVRK